MPMRWSPSTGHFYHAELNAADLPADAVRITRRRHAELLLGRSAGRAIVAGANGRPVLGAARKPALAELRAHVVASIKREARARILAVASLERQANDNAALAIAALADDLESAAAYAARLRRMHIDAIRAASNAIEAAIADWSIAALIKFDPGADLRWPAGA